MSIIRLYTRVHPHMAAVKVPLQRLGFRLPKTIAGNVRLISPLGSKVAGRRAEPDGNFVVLGCAKHEAGASFEFSVVLGGIAVFDFRTATEKDINHEPYLNDFSRAIIKGMKGGFIDSPWYRMFSGLRKL